LFRQREERWPGVLRPCRVGAILPGDTRRRRGSECRATKVVSKLNWTNKHLRLLAHEDGSYEWLDPADYRVAEVRLLHEVETVGSVGKQRAADNLLIKGDALHALTSLIRLPEFQTEYVGKVKLAYIDPPFNTGQAFEHYDDALEHSVWLTMMRDRVRKSRTS
jgi:adenine-specific DNA-methyltransferase